MMPEKEQLQAYDPNLSLLIMKENRLTDIKKPTNNDVLCGRGGFTNYHVGNCKWRKMISSNRRTYISLRKEHKMSIARSIVKAVRSQKPPDRFLQQDKCTKLWFDIGDKKAIFKTGQGLREGAPHMRKQMREENEAKKKNTDMKFISTGNSVVTPSSIPSEKERIHSNSHSQEPSISSSAPTCHKENISKQYSDSSRSTKVLSQQKMYEDHMNTNMYLISKLVDDSHRANALRKYKMLSLKMIRQQYMNAKMTGSTETISVPICNILSKTSMSYLSERNCNSISPQQTNKVPIYQGRLEQRGTYLAGGDDKASKQCLVEEDSIKHLAQVLI